MEVKAKCPHCGRANMVETDDHGLDFSEVSESGHFENLYERCCDCKESFLFDILLRPKAVTYSME